MFWQRCWWKWKETSIKDFLHYQKRIYPMDVFIIMQLSVNDFRVRKMGRKQQHCKKLKQIRYFNITNITEYWCEIGCTSEGSIINRSWITQYLLAIFSQRFPNSQMVYGQLAMSLRCMKRLVLYKCQCFCLFDVQQWSVLS